MTQTVHRSLRLLSLLLVGTALGCGSSSVTPPATTQGIRVAVGTSGYHLDPDGYTIVIGATQRAVPSEGSVTFDALEPGRYTVTLSGLAANCVVRETPEVEITVTEGATAEVTFRIDCAYDVSGAVLPVIGCPGMAPEVDHGLPGDPIALGTLPAALQPPLFARVSWSGGDEALLAYVDPDAVTMDAPVHPSGSVEGGDVEIRISDEEGACAAFAFTVDPLPAAPGEYAAIVDLLQDLIEAQAALAGYTVTELIETPIQDLPVPLLGLAVAQSLVDHPDNPNSMRAAAEGTAPDLAGLDLAPLDALFARSGVRAEMEAALTTTREGVALLDPAPAGPAGASGAPIVDALDCLLGGIDDGASLDTCMTIARDKIPGPAGTRTREIISGYAAGMKLVPGLPNFVGTVLSEYFLVLGHYEDLLASSLPTEFVSMSVTPSPPFFYEDEGIRGTWAPAMVTARSTGYDFDKLLQDILLRGIKASESYKAWLKAQGQAAAAAQGIEGNAAWEQFLTSLFSTVMSPYLKQLLSVIDGLQGPPQPFGPVPLDLEEHVTFRMTPGVFVTRFSHEEFEPRERGTDNIHVITAAGRFGGANIQTDPPVPVTVGAIHLAWWEDLPGGFENPNAPGINEVYVDSVGQTLDLLLSVAESAHPDSVALDPIRSSQGTVELKVGTGGFSGSGFGSHQVKYTAPANLDSLPVILTAEHTARTGARQYSEEPRVAQLTIRPRLIRVEPQGACIPPEGLQFTHQAFGLENPEVTWSASIGDISDSGYYTPPEGAAPGTAVTVTATSVQKDDVDASVTAVIGCVCSFSLRVGGNLYESVPGDRIDYMPDASRQDGIITVQLTSAASGDQVLFSLGGAPTLPGSYDVDNVGGTLGYGGANGYGLFSPDVATFDLLEYMPHTSMRGGVNGTVRDAFDGAAGSPLDLSAVFSVVPDGGTFLGYYCEVPG